MSNSSLASPRRVALAARCLALWVGGVYLLLPATRAADPSWWQARGVLDASTPAPNAVVNEGQFKHFTVCAVQELNASLASAGGAGDALNQLVAGWQQDYATNNYANDPNNPTRPYKAADFQAMTVGQLKYIAGLIYGRLQSGGYVTAAPVWLTANPATDSYLAVLGQLKSVFNFDLHLDPNGSGLPIAWENQYFGGPGVNPNADQDGDGLTNLQEFQQGSNPNDFYNGQIPEFVSASATGNGQHGAPGEFLPLPLTVPVVINGQAAINAPVTFTVTQGAGQVQRSSNSAPGSQVTVLTDFSGVAKVFFKLSNIAGAANQITATPGSGNYSATQIFNEYADAAPGGNPSPFDPSNVVATMNLDGSAVVTWTNNADPTDMESIDIMYRDINGTWKVLSNVPTGTASYLIPAP